MAIRDFKEIDDKYYYGGRLGAVYTPEQTIFKVWSPCADKVTVNLYPDGGESAPIANIPMTLSKDGVWRATVSKDLDGIYYTYTVCIDGQENETIDIYARTAGVNGKRGMVIDLSKAEPEGWNETKTVELKSYTDAVIYELHVRDFSSDPSGNFRHKGRFLAFTEKNVTNAAGELIGLDYIADLGITHIHLLPVFDFATVDESSSEPAYNWGYDPLNYNVPEGSYSTDPYNGAVRVKEFRELVMAAHEKGIGVIMDVVYNHTYHTVDSSFTKTFPYYYYRLWEGNYSNGSGCGNEFASEHKMARKYIIDSLCYLAETYKLDGFRFDLMGLLDIETLNKAADKLRLINPDIILYGEGWTGGGSPLDERLRAMKFNIRSMPDYGVFSDEFRDSVKGSVFDAGVPGYVNGACSCDKAQLIKSSLCGWVGHPQIMNGSVVNTPSQIINYVEAHDNLTYYDKLVLSMPGAHELDIIAADKLGAALVFLSQGVPFMQAGQEFLRSKPLPDGGFDHNSYNAPDSVNSIKWDRLTNYHEPMEYYKGLIAIRRKFSEFRMRYAEEIRTRISFHDLENGAFIAQIGRFMLIVNPLTHDLRINANGYVYADMCYASAEPIYHVNGEVTCGRRSILLIKNKK